jgi:hypothetical protein
LKREIELVVALLKVQQQLFVLQIITGWWRPKHFDVPSMVGVHELVSALFVGKFGVAQETRTERMRLPERLGETHPKVSRKRLPSDRPHVKVSMKATAALVVGFHDNEDVRLFGLAHGRLPMRLPHAT